MFHSVDMWQAAANALRPLRRVHYIPPPTVGRPHCIWDYCSVQPRSLPAVTSLLQQQMRRRALDDPRKLYYTETD